MKKLLALLVFVLSIATPASAHAEGILPPVGATACDAAGYCITWEPGDTYKGTGAPQIFYDEVTGERLMRYSWEDKKFHKWRTKREYVRASFARVFKFAPNHVDMLPLDEKYATAGTISFHDESLNAADCDPTGENHRFIAYDEKSGAQMTWDAPSELAQLCGYPIQPVPGTSPTPTVEKPAPAVAEPAKAQTCTPISVARKRVTVTSLGQACASARNILAHYMSTGTEPRGWVCSKLSVGRARIASCGMPSRAAKKIVGRWRA